MKPLFISFNKPKELLESWLEYYSILKKCKIRTYASTLSGRSDWFKALKKSGFDQDVILALHSAAEAHGYKNTHLEGLELYVLDPSIRAKLESALQCKLESDCARECAWLFRLPLDKRYPLSLD